MAVKIEELEDLVRHYNRAQNLKYAKEFAKKWFGDGVVKLGLDLESNYDDEGGSYLSLESVSAYDANGDNIDPLFETITDEELEAYDDPDNIPDEDDFRDECSDMGDILMELAGQYNSTVDLTQKVEAVDLEEWTLVHTPKVVAAP